ncbi:hypothetical protein V2J91_10680 [Pseudomonas alliivorans]|nr:hypothetical protein [Pseudomonas alliivorans]MEE5146548.1 hypothetical protein [Pseudomonas alliivorans]
MKNSGRICHDLHAYQLSQDEFQTRLDSAPIQNLMLHCESDRKLDIGALCYEKKNYQSRFSPKPVDLSTLRNERLEPLRAWCSYNGAVFHEEGSGYSLYQSGTELARLCVWCDENGHENFLVDPVAYKSALDNYTAYLQNSQISNSIGVYTANRLQAQAIVCGNIFFPGTPLNFRADLLIISNPRGGKNSTRTPSKEEMAAHLTPCQYIFDGLTDFLVEGRTFPYRTPYMETHALLSPVEFPIITPGLASVKEKIEGSVFWNYTSGKINPLAECIKNSQTSRSSVEIRWNKAVANLENANHDPRHPKRQWLAKMAQDAFFSLFIANTGMNIAPARALLYSESYEYTKSENQGFRTVKCRANGMRQAFEIHNTFVKQFKKFIKLRSYINQGIDSPYLFIGFKHYIPHKHRITGDLIYGLNERITRFLDEKFNGLTARELRKYKPVYLLNNGFSVPVVAATMQHSGTTTLTYYADAQEKVAVDEITAMLNLASEIFEAHHAENSPAGQCNTNSPSESAPAPEAYKPNCKNFLGCLFCSEFRVHADADGIRKLLSMRYIIVEYLDACENTDHFTKVHGAALTRLDSIISRLTELRPDLLEAINAITNEIQQEFKLHPYWERLYERLINIRVLK